MKANNYCVGRQLDDGYTYYDIIVLDAGPDLIVSRYNILFDDDAKKVINGQDYLVLNKKTKDIHRIKNGKTKKQKSCMNYCKGMGNYHSRSAINSNYMYINNIMGLVDCHLYKKHHYGRVLDALIDQYYKEDFYKIEEWCKVEGLIFDYSNFNFSIYDIRRLPRVKDVDKNSLKQIIKIAKILNIKISTQLLRNTFEDNSISKRIDNKFNSKTWDIILNDENVEIINHNCNYYGTDKISQTMRDVKNIDEIIENHNLNVNNFIKYVKKIHHKEILPYERIISFFRDYTNNRKYVEKVTNKKFKVYPDNLLTEEHKMSEMQKNYREEIKTVKFKEAYKRNKILEYEDVAYKIITPEVPQDIIDEGNMQGNCVGSFYLNRVAEGESKIYFMRKKEDIEQSYITIEVNGNYINQALKSSNERLNENSEEDNKALSFLKSWAEEKELTKTFSYITIGGY